MVALLGDAARAGEQTLASDFIIRGINLLDVDNPLGFLRFFLGDHYQTLRALINDVLPLAVIGRFFGYFRMVSPGAGIFFNLAMINHAEEHCFRIFVGPGLFYGIGPLANSPREWLFRARSVQ